MEVGCPILIKSSIALTKYRLHFYFIGLQHLSPVILITLVSNIYIYSKETFERKTCNRLVSNPRPLEYKSNALTTELRFLETTARITLLCSLPKLPLRYQGQRSKPVTTQFFLSPYPHQHFVPAVQFDQQEDCLTHPIALTPIYILKKLSREKLGTGWFRTHDLWNTSPML